MLRAYGTGSGGRRHGDVGENSRRNRNRRRATLFFLWPSPSAGSDLIGGSDAFICDECVAACNDITADGGVDRSATDDDREEDTDDGADAVVAPTFFRLLTEADVNAVLPMDAV